MIGLSDPVVPQNITGIGLVCIRVPEPQLAPVQSFATT
jgi:hypothetical protein